MEYKYFGLELTPTIFKDLLIQFFDGKQFNRKDAINVITKYHSDNGGVLNKPSYVSVFKKATQGLNKNGIENVGYGTWRLCYEKEAVEEIVAIKDTEEGTYSADKKIGEGKNAVYVYYYDCYKELSLLLEKDVWQCKIGRTDVDPIGRVFSQAGTCYPELPHLALVIYCDDSSTLERALHNILIIRKRWISNAPGKEWFMTSPEEIESIYYSIIMQH